MSSAGSLDTPQPLVALLEDELEDAAEMGELRHEPFSWRQLARHVGPGFLMCIAFVDPGNLEADLQTGAKTGYTLLWVLLASTVMGFLLQSLASRLGVATGEHLATLSRRRYPGKTRTALWLMAELAVIGSDVQEVVGTSLALNLLSRGHISLAAGVGLAAVAAFTLLLLERAGLAFLEATFQLLVAIMAVSMGALVFAADVPYAEAAEGLVIPRLPAGTASIACGLLGAIIMPHNLFLHSALVATRPVRAHQRRSWTHGRFGAAAGAGGGDGAWAAGDASGEPGAPLLDGEAEAREAPRPEGEAEGGSGALERHQTPSSISTLRSSIRYYAIESALALAVTLFINASVITVFAAGFFGTPEGEDMGLANAGEYLGARYGKRMELIWGVGLLAAGQSSTMTGTYAGQFIMQGFLDIKMSASRRALLTRGIAIGPTFLVALMSKNTRMLDQVNQWINIFQSVQLPFAVIPLLVLTSSKRVMGPRFVSGPKTIACALLVALSILSINVTTAAEAIAGSWPTSPLWRTAILILILGYLSLVLAIVPGVPVLAARARAALPSLAARDPADASALSAPSASPPSGERKNGCQPRLPKGAAEPLLEAIDATGSG